MSFSRLRTWQAAAGTAALLTLGAACGPPAGGLQVSDARLRAPIPGQDKTAGYFTVHNAGTRAVVLVGAESPVIRSIEMHVTEHDGDMMRMRRLDQVVVPAGDTVRFEPGGRHLMLFGVPSLDDATEIVLLRQDGGRIPVRFETIAMGDA